MSISSKTFTVTADQADLVARLLAEHHIYSQSEACAAAPAAPVPIVFTDSEMEDNEVEVERVMAHRVDANGQWSFEIKFKGDDATEWVQDADCNCEKLINAYLAAIGVSTVYVLCRISKKADPNSVSLSAQASQMVQALRTQGCAHRIKVVQVVGSAFKRIPSAFRTIGEAVRMGSTLMFYRVDRLSRNIVESLAWLEDLNNRRVNLQAFSENISYAANKTQFIEGVLGAQKESEMIGRRVTMGLEARRARGDTVFGSVPYGQKTVRMPDGHLEAATNEDEHNIILSLTVRSHPNSLARMSGPEAASVLNTAGNRKRGRKWTGAMVSALRSSHKARDAGKIVANALFGVAKAAAMN